jgi:hypothetical protein
VDKGFEPGQGQDVYAYAEEHGIVIAGMYGFEIQNGGQPLDAVES